MTSLFGMFLDQTERWAVCPFFGNADIGVGDTATGEIRRIPWNEAQAELVPRSGVIEVFPIQSRLDNHTVLLSLHPFDHPTEPIAKVRITVGGEVRFEGDRKAWSLLRVVTYTYMSPIGKTAEDEWIIVIEPDGPSVTLRKFKDAPGWPEYAPLAGLTTVPDSHLVVIAIHHDSSDPRPIVFDAYDHTIVGRIPLVRNTGQNEPVFRPNSDEAWLVEEDIVQRHRLPDWSMEDAKRLQPTQPPYSYLSLGSLFFNPSGDVCAVSRPESGDVLGISADSFDVTHRAETGGHPYRVALLSDGRVFALDGVRQDRRLAPLKPWNATEDFPRAGASG